MAGFFVAQGLLDDFSIQAAKSTSSIRLARGILSSRSRSIKAAMVPSSPWFLFMAVSPQVMIENSQFFQLHTRSIIFRTMATGFQVSE